MTSPKNLEFIRQFISREIAEIGSFEECLIERSEITVDVSVNGHKARSRTPGTRRRLTVVYTYGDEESTGFFRDESDNPSREIDDIAIPEESREKAYNEGVSKCSK